MQLTFTNFSTILLIIPKEETKPTLLQPLQQEEKVKPLHKPIKKVETKPKASEKKVTTHETIKKILVPFKIPPTRKELEANARKLLRCRVSEHSEEYIKSRKIPMNLNESVFIEELNLKYQIRGNIISIVMKGHSSVELKVADLDIIGKMNHQEISKYGQTHFKAGKRGPFYQIAELMKKGLIPIEV